MATNYKQIYAIKKANEEKIKRLCPGATENSGIYVFWRIDENMFKFAYVGQAKNLLKRLAEHLSGYQHIDCSIKKHKLYDAEKTPYGYHVEVIEECSVDDLDTREQYWIKWYADQGYQLRNATTGSQGEGKKALGEGKSTKGYRDGLAQGRKNTQKEIAKLFEKNLTYEINGKTNKNKQKAYDKFTDFLNEGKGEM
jgi:group I intron endonuclease